MDSSAEDKRELSAEALELIAARFKLLAEPMRLRLLNTLMSGERTVTQLVDATGAGQANVSKHLGLLASAGMVARRKEGLNVYYFIADPSLFELCNLVCRRLEERLTEHAEALAPAPAGASRDKKSRKITRKTNSTASNPEPAVTAKPAEPVAQPGLDSFEMKFD